MAGFDFAPAQGAATAGGFDFAPAQGSSGAGAPGVPWTPAEISTDLWFRSDEGITATGEGRVSDWEDQSGNSRDLSQSSAGRQPDYSATSFNSAYPGLTFYGDYLTRTTTGSASAYRTFLLAVDATYPYSWSYIFDAATDRPKIYVNADNDGWRCEDSTASGDKPTGPRIMSLEMTNNGQVFVDGVSVHAPTWDPGTLTLDGATKVGANNTGSSSYYGVLAEMVVSAAALSPADRQKAEGYLAHKFGLEGNLDPSHPYKTNPPTV